MKPLLVKRINFDPQVKISAPLSNKGTVHANLAEGSGFQIWRGDTLKATIPLQEYTLLPESTIDVPAVWSSDVPFGLYKVRFVDPSARASPSPPPVPSGLSGLGSWPRYWPASSWSSRSASCSFADSESSWPQDRRLPGLRRRLRPPSTCPSRSGQRLIPARRPHAAPRPTVDTAMAANWFVAVHASRRLHLSRRR